MQIIYTISRLNQEARLLLESHFTSIFVEGEISNLRCHSSGHWYFTLKDEKSQITCAMFRMKNSFVDFKPQDGMHVMVRAKVSLYEERGNYQLIVETMELSGDGQLKRRFELLKRQLHAEGLFDQQHKKPLPPLPKTIGVITSPTGAAIRDILAVLKRRFPAIPVIIYPSQVQGNKAADDIVAAIQLANQRQECDVLLLSRGGGSLEDLWPFNEERVARAIFASVLPIVSGVGHEVDITISDFVADVRAATPSAAAELMVPDKQHYLLQCQQLEIHLGNAILRFFAHWQLKLDHLQQRLQHPGAKLQRQMQHVDQLTSLLEGYFRQQLHRKHTAYLLLQQRLQQNSPSHRLPLLRNHVQQLGQHLQQQIQNHLFVAKNQFSQLIHTLEAVSPLATLNRGYAIVSKEQNQVLSSISEAKLGDLIQARVIDGVIQAKISHISPLINKSVD